MPIRNFMVRKHVKDCSAVAMTKEHGWRKWNTPYYFNGEDAYRRNVRFLVLKCNSIKCNAEVHVRESDVLDKIFKELK